MTGRSVATVADTYFEAENNEFTWDQAGLDPGVYFLNMKAGDYSETKMPPVTN